MFLDKKDFAEGYDPFMKNNVIEFFLLFIES